MNDQNRQAYFETLENGQEFYFRDWSSNNIPKICAGVYTIWQDQKLIYVGMSGRSLSAEQIETHCNNNSKAKGLFTRLKSHASGRRSGDHFCVYVGDRLVLPLLSQVQIIKIGAGELSFDSLIKDFIHKNLTYRFVETPNDETAFFLEKEIRSGALKDGNPFLNPLQI